MEESSELIEARSALEEAVVQAKVAEEISRRKQIEQWKKSSRTKDLPTTELEQELLKASRMGGNNVNIESVLVSMFVDFFLDDIRESREIVAQKEKLVDDVIAKANEEKFSNIRQAIPDYATLSDSASPSEQLQQCVKLLEAVLVCQRRTEERVKATEEQIMVLVDRKNRLSGKAFGAVCVLPDGRIVSSGLSDRTLRIWDSSSGECLKNLTSHVLPVHSICVLPDGRIVSGSCDKTVRIWDSSSGECLKILSLSGHSSGVLPDGRIVSVSNKEISFLDSFSGEREDSCLILRSRVNRICVLPDGRIICTIGNDIEIWDTSPPSSPPKNPIKSLTGHYLTVNAVCVLPDGRIVSGSHDKTLRIWDSSSGECLKTLWGHELSVCAICVLPDGRIVSSDSQTLRIWNSYSGECFKTISEHAPVHAICVLPDERIVIGYNDTTLRFWVDG